MGTASYELRRGQLEEYFDRTAAAAWANLTSDRPVSGIRASVRSGRDRMRALLLGYLPEDLTGQRVLDAGCGTGALAVEAARRGAEVVAIDLSSTLVTLARERMPALSGPGSIDFRVSDMLDPKLGRFDWVVAMDSLIHYQLADMIEMLGRLVARAEHGVAFTFAPGTPLLRMMQVAGRVLPPSDRSPAIVPISADVLQRRIAEHKMLSAMRIGRSERVNTTFYKSQAMQLVRS